MNEAAKNIDNNNSNNGNSGNSGNSGNNGNNGTGNSTSNRTGTNNAGSGSGSGSGSGIGAGSVAGAGNSYINLYPEGAKAPGKLNQNDSIRISNEVITQIIIIATGKINGALLPSAGVGDGIAGFLGKKGSARGIRIEADEKNIDVDISVTIDYGLQISKIAKALQDEIRNDLIEMTGLNVTNVNIHVLSINTKSPKKDLPQAPHQEQPQS